MAQFRSNGKNNTNNLQYNEPKNTGQLLSLKTFRETNSVTEYSDSPRTLPWPRLDHVLTKPVVARCLTQILLTTLNSQRCFGSVHPLHQVRRSHSKTLTSTHMHAHHTHMHAAMHACAETPKCTHTHLHTQHTAAGSICARANSKQLWSSYQNRSPKALSVQLLSTKSFISLDPSHTINHGCYSIIVMYIFLWSHLTIVDWIHYANTWSQEFWWARIVFTVSPLSLCCFFMRWLLSFQIWYLAATTVCKISGEGATFSIVLLWRKKNGNTFWFSCHHHHNRQQ